MAGVQSTFESISSQLGDLRVIIPREQIVSARLFNPVLYGKFLEEARSRREEDSSA